MPYQLPVYSDEELAKATSYPPLECGRYKFKVIKREEGTTKNGNHMESLIFDVYHRGQNSKPMKCYHRFFIEQDATKPNHMYDIKKIKDFLDCIGVEYTADAFSRVVGREGNANFLVDVYEKDGKEREKFVVSDTGFSNDDNIAPVAPTQMNAQPEKFDDDIPF